MEFGRSLGQELGISGSGGMLVEDGVPSNEGL